MELDVEVPDDEYTRFLTIFHVYQFLGDTVHELFQFLDLELTILDRPWIQMGMKHEQVILALPLSNVLPPRHFDALSRLGPTFGVRMFGSVDTCGSGGAGVAAPSTSSPSTNVVQTPRGVPQCQVGRIDEFRPKRPHGPSPPLVKKGGSIGGELKVVLRWWWLFQLLW